jgi:hypothetical protein
LPQAITDNHGERDLSLGRLSKQSSHGVSIQPNSELAELEIGVPILDDFHLRQRMALTWLDPQPLNEKL